MTTRVFDLNVEEVLQDWQIRHGIREVIANALDEMLLTSTQDIDIHQESQGVWHIRDYGRGIKIEHFTLNEDPEKLETELPVIGKFGVGLKDALATFHRRGVSVTIRSPHGTFRLKEAPKHGFEDIITLHVEFDSVPNAMEGTEFILGGVPSSEMRAAKALFLRFSDVRAIESTMYGEILSRNDDSAIVYIRGVLASKEENFLFSYNITDLTKTMKKRLNRERLNVGRTTYTDRVKSILLSANSDEVKSQLIEQVRRRSHGDQRDELGWIDVSQHALNLMAERMEVAYVTEEELQTRADLIGSAKRDGLEVVVVSERQREKVVSQAQQGGLELRTVDVYAREFNESFEFKFIRLSDLSANERRVFSRTAELLALVGVDASRKFDVRISETMRITDTGTEGVWDQNIGSIVIKRTLLSSLESYASTLLHEVAHATSGYPDATRLFESVLTDYIGALAVNALDK